MADPDEAFEKLEEKLARVAEIFKQTQSEKRALEAQLEKLSSELKDRAKRTDGVERDLLTLRREREEVRERLEKLLRQLDVLTKSDSTE